MVYKPSDDSITTTIVNVVINIVISRITNLGVCALLLK